MSGFYRQLRKTLEKEQGDVYTETILRGEHAGEKRILSGNGPENGVSKETDNGKDVFRERIGRPETDHLRCRTCIHTDHKDRENAGICGDGPGGPPEVRGQRQGSGSGPGDLRAL